MSHRNQQMKTVLVVDDEESILEIAAAILDRGGFKAVCVDSVDAAEHALENGGIDLALIDVVLPGRGGLDLLMTLRGRQPQLPVVMMSGKVNTGAEPFGKLVSQFGSKSVIAKPFTAQQLLSTIEAAFSPS
jgi:DNA-binding NtrC family response regulator